MSVSCYAPCIRTGVVGTELGNASPRRIIIHRRMRVAKGSGDGMYTRRVTGNAYAVYIDVKLHAVREHVTADRHVFD